MASVINSMPSEVFGLPQFLPASQANNGGQTSYENQASSGDDPLDFDMLAEYLLDDGNIPGVQMEFSDFTIPLEEPQKNAAVSPDLVSTSLPEALLDGILFNIDVPNNVPNNDPIITPHVENNSMSIDIAPTPIAPTPPAPLALAPAPVPMHNPPILQGIIPNPAPATQQMIVHQHKRQKIEPAHNPQTSQVLHRHHAVTPSANVPTTANTTAAITAFAAATTQGHKTGKQKSQAQIDRRRERNRILARRTRLRKKFFFESLQQEVMDLQQENMALKEIVRNHMEPAQSKPILESCTANTQLPDVVLEHCGDPSALGTQDFSLMTSIKQSQQSFVITDPSLQDNPIVYASDGFLALTEYSRDQVLGRNCRFLQGTDTNPAKVARVRKAVTNGQDVSVTFINYTANGAPFWNKLFIAALRDAQNNIVNFIGVSVRVAGPAPDDPEAGKVFPGELPVDGNTMDIDGMHASTPDVEGSVDTDAAVMAIEGAVDKTVAATQNVVKPTNTTSPSN